MGGRRIINKKFFLFFSSKSRHTRFSRDWSSDVCSSDLGADSGFVHHSAGTAASRKAAVHSRMASGSSSSDSRTRITLLANGTSTSGLMHRTNPGVSWTSPPCTEVHRIDSSHWCRSTASTSSACDTPPGTTPMSDRQDAVLAPGALDGLGLADLQTPDDRGAGVLGFDEVVHERPAGGDVRADLLADHVHHLVPHDVLGV